MRRAALRVRPWDVLLTLAFVPGPAWAFMVSIIAPYTIGGHGAIYSEAARAWLTGGNPWQVGPPTVVFAGPPTMLLPFAPSAFLDWDIARFAWVAVDVAVVAWALHRLRVRAYWILFPPLFDAIVYGHPEVLVLGLLVIRHPIGGLALLIKPYVVFPLLAERQWRWLIVGALAAVATAPFLPWTLFVSELDHIRATMVQQSIGDSTFGQPLLMIVAVAALAALGPRRALWFAVPVLWPYAQTIYKVAAMPLMPPVLALAWAIPIPGMTLVGLVVLAVLVLIERRRALPGWLATGIRPASSFFVAQSEDGRAESVGGLRAGTSVGAA